MVVLPEFRNGAVCPLYKGFNRISYEYLKAAVISEMKQISDILSQWLNTQFLHIKSI